MEPPNMSFKDLLDAVINNDPDIERKLENVCEPLLNSVDEYSMTILQNACHNSSVTNKTITSLLKCGADINYKNTKNNDWQAIHYAAQRADSEIFKLIFDRCSVTKKMEEYLLDIILHQNIQKNKEEVKKCIDVVFESLGDNISEIPVQTAEEHVLLPMEQNDNIPTFIWEESKNGHHKCFKLLLNYVPTNYKKYPVGLLCCLLEKYHYENIETASFSKCCDYLLDKFIQAENKNYIYDYVNMPDERGNYALYLAILYAEPTVETLLKFGASLTSKNKYGFMPIQNINVNLLESHLNTCIQYDGSSVQFSLKSLFTVDRKQNLVPNEGNCTKSYVVSETEAIYNIENNKKLYTLLQHPVLATFLIYKWKKMSGFYISYIIYCAICLVLNLFLFITNKNNVFYFILTWIHFFLFRVYPIYINFHLERLYQIIFTLICFAIILYISSLGIAYFILIYSFFEFIIAQCPYLPFCRMFICVLINYLKVMVYFIIIIVFFSIMFFYTFPQKCKISKSNNNDTNSTEASLLDCIFKTTIMSAGELDASSFSFINVPLVGYLIYCMFLFIVVIILNNLLTALAINDKMERKSDRQFSKIQNLYNFESMLLKLRIRREWILLNHNWQMFDLKFETFEKLRLQLHEEASLKLYEIIEKTKKN